MSQSLTRYLDMSAPYDLPVEQSERKSPKPQLPPEEIAETWLDHFNKAIMTRNASAITHLFHSDGWWRDVLALSWDSFRTYHTTDAIEAMLKEKNTKELALSNFRIEPNKAVDLATLAPVLGESISAHFVFENKYGTGRGIVFLTAADDSGRNYKAFSIYTSLQELRDYKEKIGPLRPRGVELGDQRGEETWIERRLRELNMEETDPTVLVIGAGHSGLDIAARLGALDVSTLVIDKNERIGDNWRKRYKSLVLHDPVWYDHMPYLPFPPNWPIYSPKDKIAEWLEMYSKVMEINVWTSATVDGQPIFDAKSHKWIVRLRRADGTERVIRPRHIVLALGLYALPYAPKFPGAETFRGDLMHTSDFPGGEKYARKSAVIIGGCTSAHDIAMELYDNNAKSVMMVQRSSTFIVGQPALERRLFAPLYCEGAVPAEEADLFSCSIPFPVAKLIHQEITRKIAEDDKEMLIGLEKQGFKIDYGFEGAGIMSKFIAKGGGYYIDVGCSQLICEGKIKVKQGKEIQKIVEDGVILEDGTKLEADLVVLATGYLGMKEAARQIFGDEVANRVSQIGGLNAEAEFAGMWQKSGQEGLWFMAGNLAQARCYSKFLAIQIKAKEEGLVA